MRILIEMATIRAIEAAIALTLSADLGLFLSRYRAHRAPKQKLNPIVVVRSLRI